MTCSIRLATSSDFGALVEMRRAFTLEDEPLGGLRSDYEADMRSFLEEGLDSGRWKVWIAEVEGEVVSHVYLALVDKVPRPSRANRWIAYMTNVYTRPEHRGAGIGAELLNTVTAWAASNDVELIGVWPSETSVAFYGRNGFASPADLLVWEAASMKHG
jgi:GNAT superfamily N-acetyltransferase